MKGYIRKFLLYGVLCTSLGVLPIAQAATFLGNIDAGDAVFSTAIINGDFDFDYTFNLGSGVTSAQVGTASSTLTMFGFSVLDFSTLNATLSNPMGDIISTGSALNSQFSAFINAPILAGLYSLNVNGTTSGFVGGVYTVGVSAVPIPAAVILFATGLVGLLGLARRKHTIKERVV